MEIGGMVSWILLKKRRVDEGRRPTYMNNRRLIRERVSTVMKRGQSATNLPLTLNSIASHKQGIT
jgi:hypothetical protein